MSCKALISACAFGLAFVLPSPSDAATDSATDCPTARARVQELRRIDEAYLLKIRPAAETVPDAISQVFHQLARVARLPVGARLRLVAVNAGRNASVDHSGTVLISAMLWSGEGRLNLEEVAAVLAHEIAHVEASDSLRRLCDTVALVGTEADSGSAAPLDAPDDRTLLIRMMQLNHLRELRADQRGAQLLAAAGFPPEAMARMLIKVTRGQSDYSASHPALEHRLEALGREHR